MGLNSEDLLARQESSMEKSMLETKRDFQKAAQISVHLYFTMVTLAGSTCGLCLTLGKESIY